MTISNGQFEPLKLNLQLFAEPGGESGAGESSPAGDDPNGGTGGETGAEENSQTEHGADDAKALMAQIEQLKADMARQKKALDDATSEAGKYKKELRAKQTQEEIAAANKAEEEEKAATRLAELEREVARAKSTKSVMSKLNVDEDTAGNIAECLTGCEDVENALLLIQKVIDAKIKALKLEYGKIPGPGTGGSSEDKEMQEAIKLAKELGRRRAQTSESVREQLRGLVR